MGVSSTSAGTRRLLRNLAAIDEVSPALGQRIRLPVESDHVIDSDGARPLLKLGRGSTDLHHSILDHDLPNATRDSSQVLVFGIGLGEGLAALMRRSPKSHVTAWERDPWMLRLALSRHDFRREIRTGRLRLLLGPDVIELRGANFDASIQHPLLGDVYAREWAFAREPKEKPCILVCAGELFVHDLDEALRDQGYATYTWEVSRLSSEELSLAITRLSPEMVAGINYTEGLSEACFHGGLPLVIWEIDPSLQAPRPCQTPTNHAHIFTYRKENVDRYSTAGFEQVSYLPLAANVERRRTIALTDTESTQFSGNVCFVGNSTADRIEPAIAGFTADYERSFGPSANATELLENILDTQARTPGAYVIPELLEASHPGWRAFQAKQGEVDPAMWVGEIATAQRRLSLVGMLGDFGIRVWGDPGWQACESKGAEYMGRAGHSQGLTCIYNAGLIHVDIGRIYQSDIVTMRVFDVLACGSLLLAEHTESLLALFEPGVHLDTWKTPEELYEKVAWYLEHPEQATTIAQAGQAHVQQHHRIRQRVAHMLEAVTSPSRMQAV